MTLFAVAYAHAKPEPNTTYTLPFPGNETRVPMPSDGFSQVVRNLQWSQQPEEKIEDRFGQEVARFRDIEIAPVGHHELSYATSVYTRAVQFDPPVTPLSSLNEIPPEIQETYLAADPIFTLDAPELVAAAREARFAASGEEAADVRSLIENIAGISHEDSRT